MSEPKPQPDDASPTATWQRRVRAARASASAADGLVRVEVDASGEILDVALDPRAMRLPSVDLAAALRSAGNDAHRAARTQLETTPPPAMPDAGDLHRLLSDVTVATQQRLGEFAEYARTVTDHVDRS